jgi:hypothetical protein
VAGRNSFLLVHADDRQWWVDENRARDDTVIDPPRWLARQSIVRNNPAIVDSRAAR